MATRKSDADRGPTGAWAYGVRTSFRDERGKPNLRPEEIAPLMVGRPHPATIRKIESDPDYHPDEMVQDLFRVYRRLGDQRGVHVPQPPLGQTLAVGGDQSALVAALNRQSSAIEALVALIAKRDGFTLDELAEAEGSNLARLFPQIQQATSEAIQRDRTPEPEAPPQPGRKPRLLEPSKP